MAKLYDGGPKSVKNRANAAKMNAAKNGTSSQQSSSQASGSESKNGSTNESEVLRKMYDAIVKQQDLDGGKEPFLVDGAMLLCYQGTEPQPLKVSPPHDILKSDKQEANKDDRAVGTNILPYGKCKKTNKPCLPDTAKEWINTKKDEETGGKDALIMQSFLVCYKGGLIMPLTCGLGMFKPGSGVTSELINEIMTMSLDEAYRKSILDLRYGVEFYMGSTGVGNRKVPPLIYDEKKGKLSLLQMLQIKELSKMTGVDYYLIIATALHESSFDANSNKTKNQNGENLAMGLMQLIPSMWKAYGLSGGSGYHLWDDLKPFISGQGANLSDSYDFLTNLAIGVAAYRGWRKQYDYDQAINHYGEGSTVPENKGRKGSEWILAPSAIEVLYYRDIIAIQNGVDPWYMDKYYTNTGVNLIEEG